MAGEEAKKGGGEYIVQFFGNNKFFVRAPIYSPFFFFLHLIISGSDTPCYEWHPLFLSFGAGAAGEPKREWGASQVDGACQLSGLVSGAFMGVVLGSDLSRPLELAGRQRRGQLAIRQMEREQPRKTNCATHIW